MFLIDASKFPAQAFLQGLILAGVFPYAWILFSKKYGKFAHWFFAIWVVIAGVITAVIF